MSIELVNAYLLENIHFKEYTLTKENVTHIWIASFLFWIVVSVLAVNICGSNRRKLAWVISLVNSFCMMMVGIIYSYVKFSEYPNFFTSDPAARPLIHSVNDVSVIVCIWFALANIFDIGVGMLYYPKYLDPLSAYIHHSVAIWITYATTTGDGIFTPVEPFASLFMTLMLVEVPTFLLALGAVFPALRTDLGFGVTFFIFRLAFLVMMIYLCNRLHCGTTVMVLGFAFLLLHIFWFSNWIKKYGKNIFSNNGKDEIKGGKDSKKHG